MFSDVSDKVFATDELQAYTARRGGPVFPGTLWALCRREHTSNSHRKQGKRYFLPKLTACTLQIQNGFSEPIQVNCLILTLKSIKYWYLSSNFKLFFFFVSNGLDRGLTQTLFKIFHKT